MQAIADYAPAAAAAAGHREIEDVIALGLDTALAVTRSTVGFVAVIEDGDLRLTTRLLDGAPGLSEEVMRQLARATLDEAAEAATPRNAVHPSFLAVPMRVGDETLGVIGVANGPNYAAAQREALGVFAAQLGAALEIARLRKSRQALVDTLVTVRAELDLSEQRRLLTEERARSAERLERAQSLAVETLRSVAANLRAGGTLTDFYRLLTQSVAGAVGAKRVLFWHLNEDRTLTAIAGAHGVDDSFIARLYPAPCDPEGTDLTSQVVYQDLIFRAAVGDRENCSRDQTVLDRLQVENAMSVPWRAGDERLGVVAAYDSQLPGGFTPEDAWVLQMAGLAAGLVWQLKHAEAELTRTVDRLESVDSARKLLLKNLSTAVDRARKRFATELHDDALQKLTAAELGLARISSADGNVNHEALVDAQSQLREVEEALRKLLFDFRPPALETPGGLEESVRDRLELVRSHMSARIEIDFELPADPPFEIKSLIFRQVSEALTNIEKHAHPSRVQVTLKAENDGVYGAIIDDGCGFVVSERSRLPGHLGLLALNERALLAGGWCKITSAPGAGTIVEFWVPSP